MIGCGMMDDTNLNTDNDFIRIFQNDDAVVIENMKTDLDDTFDLDEELRKYNESEDKNE